MSFSNFFTDLRNAFAVSGAANFSAHTSGSMNYQFGHAAPQEPNKQPPPASKGYMEGLVQKPVTQDDIQEANNKECLICLEDNEIGTLRVKLPCGHMFCKSCISSWLIKHCTCPACRYEVECSDPLYEAERQKRMQKSYKMRVRLDELKAMKIPEIRRMAAQLGIDISDCIDKSDIIDKLKISSKVDILEGVPVQEISEDEWESMSVGRLRALLKSYGISEDGALMKRDLRARLLDSGRVSISPALSSPSSAGSASQSAKPTSSLGGASYSTHSEGDDIAPASAYSSAAADREHDIEVKRVRLGSDEKAAHGDGGTVANDHPFGSATKQSGVNNKSHGSGATANETGSGGAKDSASTSSHHASSDSSDSSGDGQFVLGKELIESMSIRELKSVMEAYGVSTDKCLERRDLLDRMRASSRITLSED